MFSDVGGMFIVCLGEEHIRPVTTTNASDLCFAAERQPTEQVCDVAIRPGGKPLCILVL